MRLEILILITEFGLSCYQAAKVLDLPYTNCKVIYRTFRDENRVLGCSRSAKLLPSGLNDDYMLKNAYIMKKSALIKLFKAMNNGSMTDH